MTMSPSSAERGDGDVVSALEEATSSRLLLYALGTAIVGVVLILVGEPAAEGWRARIQTWPLVGGTLIQAIGESLIGAAVVLVGFEMYVRRQLRVAAELRTRALLDEYERRMSTSLLDIIRVGDRSSLEKLSAALDGRNLFELGVNALGMSLGQADMARAAAVQMAKRLEGAPTIWDDLRIQMTLRPVIEHDLGRNGKYLDLHIDASFTTDAHDPLSAICVSDLEEYNSQLKDGGHLWCWYHETTADYPRPSSSVFELIECRVDGVPMDILNRSLGSAVEYFPAPEALADQLISGERSRVALRLRIRLQRRGHCVFFEVPRICRGVRYDFDYSRCGFRFVNVLDVFGDPNRPKILRLPGADSRVAVEVDGWVYPKNGVVFVWVLEEEMTPGFLGLGWGGDMVGRGDKAD